MVQNHMAMNAHVLSNPLARFCHNEQKAIARAKRQTFLEWDKLQVHLQYTPKLPKPALVRLTFRHILRFLGMIAWGVGAMPFNVKVKLERDEDLALVIRMTQTK
jgi:hypothetical protein